MNDHDMMRNAAKAAGAERTDYSDRTPDHWIIRHADGVWREWDPENDDGDSFRLLVGLNLLFMPYPLDNATRVTRLDLPEAIVAWGAPPDARAASRLAILRAAADAGAKL